MTFSLYIVPIIIGLIIILGIINKVCIFDVFIDGAKDGFKSTISILPTLVGLITAISMLKASGALDMFTSLVSPIFAKIGFPEQVIPLMLLRPVSGSGALALADSIFTEFGPDSFIGRISSVVLGSTETTFYAIAVYFGSIGIKKTRHTVPAALIADITSYIVASITVILFFY